VLGKDLTVATQNLFSGDFTGRATRAEFGEDKSGRPKIRITMQVGDGQPHAGKTAAYDGKLDEKNVRFTKAAMVAVGWQGKDVRTFVDDVAKAQLVVPFTVEVARFERDDGSVSEWSAVRRIGSGSPLATPSKETVSDVNKWLADAGGEDIPF
jgi:hypothetical protein